MSSLAQCDRIDGLPDGPGNAARAVPGADTGWSGLLARAVEPNAFHGPGYFEALTRHAARTPRYVQIRDASGLLSGQLPVSGALRALGLPIPAAVSLFPYMPLGTPLLAGDPVEAAGGLIDAARDDGIAMLALPMVALEGPVAQAFGTALAARGLVPAIRNAHHRAALNATGGAEDYLRAGLGSKKLKELRRQRKRLEELGAVGWSVARKPEDVAAALERFLVLEAKGWKGLAGSGLGQDSGDSAFIGAACRTLAQTDGVEICELTLDGAAVASGIVLRSQNTAFFFKTAYDETYARYSPGVQLTVALTRHFADDPHIDFVDSTAAPGHPMIDHVWRERLAVGDLFVPTRAGPVPKICLAAFDARAALRARVKAAYSGLKGARGRPTIKEDAKP